MDEWAWAKDIIGPLIAGIVGLGGGLLTNLSRMKSDSIKRETDHEVAQISFDQAQMNTITERFKTLLDGYEKRIADLTNEVEHLREQLRTSNARNAAS